MNRKTEELEEIIGYHFKNKHYLTQALTHSSYANEKKLGKLGSNERLEFLGDAVLELISSDYLYARFTQIPEGELTKKRARPCLLCKRIRTAAVSVAWKGRGYDRRKKQGFYRL